MAYTTAMTKVIQLEKLMELWTVGQLELLWGKQRVDETVETMAVYLVAKMAVVLVVSTVAL